MSTRDEKGVAGDATMLMAGVSYLALGRAAVLLHALVARPAVLRLVGNGRGDRRQKVVIVIIVIIISSSSSSRNSSNNIIDHPSSPSPSSSSSSWIITGRALSSPPHHHQSWSTHADAEVIHEEAEVPPVIADLPQNHVICLKPLPPSSPTIVIS
jgi:hypothetical protein